MTNTKHETKQNASHTPGPWEDDATGSIFGDMNTDHDGDNPFVADTRANRERERSPEEIANARLIAAAPTLLDVAEEAAAEPCSLPGTEDLEAGCCKSCRARIAVAAAKGLAI